MLGRDVSVVCTHPACQAGTLRAILRTAKDIDPAAGGVRFALQPDKVFLFGRSDEKRIPFALPPL